MLIDRLLTRPYRLSLRGTLGSRDFAKASFLLRDADGNAAPSSMIVMRSVRTRLNGETTLAVRRLTIAAPGRYLLKVAGHPAAGLAPTECDTGADAT